MRGGNRKVLGVAFEERYAVVSEVRLSRGVRRVERTGEFLFPDDVGWQDPQRLGKAFGQFLRQQHFSAGRAVIGLPAKWLMAREVNVPPAAPAATADIVRLQAEREFSPDPAALGLDYLDALDAREARPVFLVGALRERLTHMQAVAEAARIRLLAVTSSALAVSSATTDSAAAVAITLVLRPGNSDLVARTGGHFCVVRHVPVPESAPGGAEIPPGALVAVLETEVRRALGTVARSHAQAGAAELTIWDGIGLPADALSGMNTQLGLEVKVRSQLPEVSFRSAQAGQAPALVRFVPATALGISALNGHRPPIDLLHSRLEPPAKRLLGRRALLALGTAAAIGVVILALALGWQREQATVAGQKLRYERMKPESDVAQELVDKLSLTRDWYEDRPRLLDCLRELTLATPSDGRVWFTKVAIKPVVLVEPRAAAAQPGKALPAKPPSPKKLLSVALIGVATDEKPLLEMRARLSKLKGVSNLNMPFTTRNNVKTGREVTFSLSFYYTASE
jgi:hypothetical protein